MGVYRMNIEGRNKPVLMRAKSLSEARGSLVDGESLTAEQVEEALVAGEKVWAPGTPLPEDVPAELEKGTEGEDS